MVPHALFSSVTKIRVLLLSTIRYVVDTAWIPLPAGKRAPLYLDMISSTGPPISPTIGTTSSPPFRDETGGSLGQPMGG
jgi:hypothetical protein